MLQGRRMRAPLTVSWFDPGVGDTCARSAWLRSLGGLALSCVIAGVLASQARAEPGDLDPTFGGDGTVLTPLGTALGDLRFRAVAVDAEGRQVAVGSSFPGFNFAVARFTDTGELDASFGGDGIVETDVGGSNYLNRRDAASSVAIDGSGRVLVGGLADSTGVGDRPTVARYLDSGGLDPTFGGGDGVATLPVDFEELGPIRAITLDADDGILLGGSFGVVRLTDAGVLDPSFGDDGIYAAIATWGLALDEDGRILVVGEGGFDGDFALARLTSAGAPDPGFGGGDGLIKTDIGSGDADRAVAVAIGADGKPTVGGSTDVFSDDSDFAVARYDSTGELDEGFGGGDGIVVTDFRSNSDDLAESMVLQAGKVVVAGTIRRDANGDGEFDGNFGVARYDASGVLDPTFSGDGLARTDIAPGAEDADEAGGVALAQDGDVVVAGFSADTLRSLVSGALVRYRTSGFLESEFGENGVALANPEVESREQSRAVLTDSLGRVIVAGLTNAGTRECCDVVVARYLPGGDLDPAFGGGDGVATVGRHLADVTAAAIDSDGAVAAIGPDVRTRKGADLVLLTASGELDHVRNLPGLSSARAVAFDWRGRVVVAGGSAHGFRLIRTTASGRLDRGFDADGIASIRLPDQQPGRPEALITGPRRRLVVVGATLEEQLPFEPPRDFVAARVTVRGEPDGTFGGGDGTVTADLGGFDGATSAAIDPAGRLVAAANSLRFGSRFAVLRYTPTGEPDPSFGGGSGQVTVEVDPVWEFEGPSEALTIDGSGRIVVSGDTSRDEVDTGFTLRRDMWLARFLPSGPLDPAFGEGGMVTTDLASRSDEVAAMTLDPEGRILLAGTSASNDLLPSRDDDLVVARYESGPEIPGPNTKITRVEVNTALREARLHFTSSGGTEDVLFRCSLDGRAFRLCSSPRRYRGLSLGKHVVAIRAVDLAGRTDLSPAKRTFQIPR